MTAFSFSDIRNALPHRYPISLVDRVVTLVPGESLRAIKCITGNEPCYALLANAVPADACAYPQTLMLESFLQAAGLFFVHSVPLPEALENCVMLFGSLTGCRFHRGALPGDVLEHRVRMDRVLSDSAILSGASYVDDELALECDQAVVAIRGRHVLE